MSEMSTKCSETAMRNLVIRSGSGGNNYKNTSLGHLKNVRYGLWIRQQYTFH